MPSAGVVPGSPKLAGKLPALVWLRPGIAAGRRPSGGNESGKARGECGLGRVGGDAPLLSADAKALAGESEV